jgi:spore coat polysaccharide biosynthesis predicted glycosyltransferase SpsG
MISASFQPLVLRANASIQSGAGHVMRCLALAKVWQTAKFLSQTYSINAIE